MCIFEKKKEIPLLECTSLFINILKFFDMSKIKQKNPILKRNGVKNSHIYS